MSRPERTEVSPVARAVFDTDCRHCGQSFTPIPDRRKTYCSRTCRNEGMKNPVLHTPRPCRRCGNEFIPVNADQGLCSRRCKARTVDELLQFFERHLDKTPGCCLWRGLTSKNGYGSITVNARLVYVHRFAYEAFIGPIPAGYQVDHLCEIKHCVRPDHLEAVTHQENLRRYRVGHPERFGEGKSVCHRGHPYSGSNLIITRIGSRLCRACKLARQQSYDRKRRAAS